MVALDERERTDASPHTLGARQNALGVPGVGVAVIKSGSVQWAQGAGWRSALGHEPVGSDTLFSVGSVSKIVNAALILRLVQGGVLDLDQEVGVYLKRWRIPDSEFPHQEV
ncbi:MAG: serine hydrolase domain-containing protein, partial [Myxococcota bacterium]